MDLCVKYSKSNSQTSYLVKEIETKLIPEILGRFQTRIFPSFLHSYICSKELLDLLFQVLQAEVSGHPERIVNSY